MWALLLALGLVGAAHAQTVTVSTFAGGQFNDGPSATARFNQANGVAVASDGTTYVADTYNHRIRKITAAGEVSTFAGSGVPGFAEGAGATAQFKYPMGVAVDAAGTVFVADNFNCRIRKITADGLVSTLAGSGAAGFAEGAGAAAQFSFPSGVAVDAAGNVFVADSSNRRIRKISADGLVSTFAGSGVRGFAEGTGTAARFDSPEGVVIDASGNVFVADKNNHRIRKITADGLVSTLAGSGVSGFADGAGTVAQFKNPTGVVVDAAGTVFVADSNNNRIRKITADGLVSTLAGSGTYGFAEGASAVAQFSGPTGVALDAAGTVLVADRYNNRIRKITADGLVSTLTGSDNYGSADGTGTAAQFTSPSAVAVDAAGNVFVADRYNHRIRKITSAGVVSTLAGSGSPGFADGAGATAQFNGPTGVAVDAAGNVFVADPSNNRIRKITTDGLVSTLAGSGVAGFADGTGTAAQFSYPTGAAVDAAGNVFVADSSNNRIRKITAAGLVSTLAGSDNYGFSDGQGAAAQFNAPRGVAVDAEGNVFVADHVNCRIRKITAAGIVSTFAGSGSPGFAEGAGAAAQFNYPWGLAVDAAGIVFVADSSNKRIRKITAAGIVSTFAGSGFRIGSGDYANGPGAAAEFSNPTGVAVNAAGNVFVADTYINAIRLINVIATTADFRQTWYGTTSNTGNAADTADPFNTGVPNLGVFAFFGPNQNPATTKAGNLPQAQLSGGNLTTSFTEPPGASGVTYGAEWSTTLEAGSWQAVPDTGTPPQHTFSVPLGTNSQLFLRLRVTSP